MLRTAGKFPNNLQFMRAITIEKFGGPDVFREAQIPLPELRPGHLLVRVLASSVNPVDCKVRSGMIPAIAPPFPAVLGCDVAGVVEAVGDGVTKFSAGDEVYFCAGMTGRFGGALAEFCLVDAAQVAKKPASLGFAAAAALPRGEPSRRSCSTTKRHTSMGEGCPSRRAASWRMRCRRRRFVRSARVCARCIPTISASTASIAL